MINKNQALRILNSGLTTGADYAEIYIEEKDTFSVTVENGKVENSGIRHSYGAGIRLLNKLQSVYGYTNEVNEKSLTKLIQNLSASFKDKQSLTLEKLVTKKAKNLSKVEQSFASTNDQQIIDYLKTGEKVMREYDKRIVKTEVSFSYSVAKVQIVSTKGINHLDYKERGRCGFMCVAADQGKIETGFEGPGASAGFGYFLNNVDVKAVAKEVASKTIMTLEAKECPSGKMPVVIGKGFGGTLFHEACGHPLEASAVSKNLSVFSGKIGQQIASPILSAVDDGTIPNEWGSNNIDDEGNKTEKTLLIENGILKDYLIDDFNGRRMGRKGNGACRRQSYKYEPTSRMSNTYICAGKSTPEEIIAATKFGLYAKSLEGGQVNPVTGEFNFGCSEAYLIRDGKICEPVRGASVIGTGQDILLKIDMIGNDLELAQGMCGAGSGFIPVDVGQPTIRVSEMTVGGNGGEIK
jgi:TldD protein